ncbi:MAG TPA: hypothetical protein PLI95_05795 [Polyangiaceae bacterium]|nr:hypothetical protein [Polyangiaceae bacterium]
MDDLTQLRGSDATRARRSLVLAVAIAASVVIHIAPFPAFLLRGWIVPALSSDDSLLEDHGTLIPVELAEEEKPPQADLPPAEDFVDPSDVAATAKPPVPTQPLAEADAGEDAAADAGTDAEADAVADARPEADAPEGEPSIDAEVAANDAENVAVIDAAAAPQDASMPPIARLPGAQPAQSASAGAGLGIVDGGAAAIADAQPDARPFTPIADPVALAGSAASLAGTPNVAAFIYSERIRRHPMGNQFGPVLSRHPQWGSFFANTNLDPIQDTDRIWLAGPQFRDTSRVVAVLRYRVPEARVRAAVSAVVKRSGSDGAWLDAGVPAAKGRADRADRLFVMPAPSILVVVPPDGLAAASKVRSIPAGGRSELFVLSLRSARNALKGFPIDVPASLENLRFSIESASDGGIDLRVSVRDKDGAAAAVEHARRLTQDVDRFGLLQVAFTSVRIFEPFSFRTDGDMIHGATHMNERQLRNALSALAAFIDTHAPPPKP